MKQVRDISLSKKTTREYKKYREIIARLGPEIPFNEFMAATYKFTRHVSRELGKQSVCKQGCSNCCRLPVDVTLAEAQWIMTHLKRDSLSPRAIPVERRNQTFCPFLKAGACSIYEVRPIACQMFHTLDDPAHCVDPYSEHEILTTNSQKQVKELVAGFYRSSMGQMLPAMADIREWFGEGEPA